MNEKTTTTHVDAEPIQNKIFTFRGVQIMIDCDLANLYEVSTKALNQAVKRNKERFPPDFMFQLNKKEMEILRSQIVTSNKYHIFRRKNVIYELNNVRRRLFKQELKKKNE